MKSPLNPITQFAEILRDDFGDKLGPVGTEILQFMMNAGKRLRTLIDDLLSYARSGKDLGKLTELETEMIVKDVLLDLFKRFEGSENTEGTGLGLPICKRKIEFHGGSM
jgi:signal transduction histidine kinase